MAKRFLRVKEARLRFVDAQDRPMVSVPRFYAMISAGVVPHKKIGRAVFIPEAEFEDWLAILEGEQNGTALSGGWL